MKSFKKVKKEDFIYFLERERNIDAWMLLAPPPPPETQPATQACAPPGNRISDPLIHRPALSH